MPSFDPLTVLFFVVALVPGMLLHELAHGFAAIRLGDPSPRMYGRMTLDLGKHVDVFGTVVLPGILLLPVLFGRGTAPFGYMKPMPVNPASLRNPDRDVTLIAVSGIAANVVLAVLGAVVLRFTRLGAPDVVVRFLGVWVYTQVLLAVFHTVVPLPPMDISKVVARFLPSRARSVYESWEQYAPLFVLVILFVLPAPILGIVDAVAGGLLDVLVG